MKKNSFIIIFLILIYSNLLYSEGEKISTELYDAIHISTYEQKPIRLWIYFKDKDITHSKTLLRNKKQIERLKKAGLTSYNEKDVPVKSDYIDILKQMNVYPETISNWLNAVSVTLPAKKIYEIENCSFIKRLDVVKSYRRSPERSTENLRNDRNTRNNVKTSGTGQYGDALEQLQSVNFPIADELGFSGKGVRICILDAGYNIQHESLAYCKIVSSYDFVSKDLNVSPQPKDPYGIADHGTAVLSIMSGYLPGKMIGPAYRADYILARTEEITSSDCVYEDAWVAALEWADSLGTEIVVSSAGVILEQIFDNYSSHTTFQNENPVYVVLKTAAERGILIVSDAPFNYDEFVMRGLVDSGLDMLLVQSVEESWTDLDLNKFNGWEVSSGNDDKGRDEKSLLLESLPEDFFVAEAGGNSFYGWRSGSAYLAAIVAASAAVIFEAHPDWTYRQLLEAVRSQSMIEGDRIKDVKNSSGLIDIFSVMNTVFPQTSGDLDGNGRIDGNDLALFSEYYINPNAGAANSQERKSADIDGNMIIDGNDLALLISRIVNK